MTHPLASLAGRRSNRHSWVPLALGLSLCAGAADDVSSQAPPSTRLGGDWSYIGSLVLLGEDRAAVSQPEERFILLVNTRDGSARQIGRRGEGPGEFRAIGRLAAHPQGFAAFDASLRRISVFDRQGRLIQTQAAPAVATAREFGAATLSPVHLGEGGAMLAHASLQRDGLAASEAMGTMVYLASRDAGTTWREIARTTARPACRVVTATVGAPVPSCEHPLSAVHPTGDGVILLEPPVDAAAPLQLRAVGADGRMRFSITFPLSRRPLPRHVQDSVRAHLRERFPGVRLPTLPTHYPRARRIVAAQDNTIWVQESPAGGRSRWIAVDTRGRRVGEITLDASARILESTTEQLWIGYLDDDGLASIERLPRTRVAGPSRIP